MSIILFHYPIAIIHYRLDGGKTRIAVSSLINKVGKLTKRDVEAIVEKKHAELTGATRLAMAKTIAGSARSMGVELDFDLAEFEE